LGVLGDEGDFAVVLFLEGEGDAFGGTQGEGVLSAGGGTSGLLLITSKLMV
jgi:hypothetical protein